MKKSFKVLLFMLVGLFTLPIVANAQVAVTDNQANVIKSQMGYYAYYDEDVAVVKQRMAFEIWDKLVHEYNGDQVGYTNSNSSYSEILNSITFGTKKTGTGIESLGYYDYTYTINGNITKTGKVYLLPSKTKFIIATMDNDDVTDYKVIDENDNSKAFIYNADKIVVFGNSVANVANFNEHDSNNVNSAMYSNFRFDFGAVGLDNSYSIQGLTINTIKSNTSGMYIDRQYSKDTRGWGLNKYPLANLSGTSLANPYKMDLYFGLNSIKYDNLSNTEGMTYLNGITSFSLGNTNNISIADNTPSKAITINKDNKTITFNSKYYSDVLFKINDGYLNVNRIAIDYQVCPYPSKIDTHCTITDSLGNDSHPVTYVEGSTAQLYAKYYYPVGATNERVNLFVTYTYADGTIKTKVVSPYDNMTAENDMQVGFDVYEILTGTEETFPETIEAIAFYGDLKSATFEGASFGKGAGVKITKSEMRFDR